MVEESNQRLDAIGDASRNLIEQYSSLLGGVVFTGSNDGLTPRHAHERNNPDGGLAYGTSLRMEIQAPELLIDNCELRKVLNHYLLQLRSHREGAYNAATTVHVNGAVAATGAVTVQKQ